MTPTPRFISDISLIPIPQAFSLPLSHPVTPEPILKRLFCRAWKRKNLGTLSPFDVFPLSPNIQRSFSILICERREGENLWVGVGSLVKSVTPTQTPSSQPVRCGQFILSPHYLNDSDTLSAHADRLRADLPETKRLGRWIDFTVL